MFLISVQRLHLLDKSAMV